MTVTGRGQDPTCMHDLACHEILIGYTTNQADIIIT